MPEPRVLSEEEIAALEQAVRYDEGHYLYGHAELERALATIREGRQLVSAAIKAGLKAVAPKSPRASRRKPSTTQNEACTTPNRGSDDDAHSLSELQSAIEHASSFTLLPQPIPA